jgi:hypothetical protein
MPLLPLCLMRRSNQPAAATSTPRPSADERPAASVRPVTRDAERWAATLLSQLDWDPRQR